MHPLLLNIYILSNFFFGRLIFGVLKKNACYFYEEGMRCIDPSKDTELGFESTSSLRLPRRFGVKEHKLGEVCTVSVKFVVWTWC